MTVVAGTDIPAAYLHRLVLGVEPIDAFSGERIGRPLRVLEELPDHSRPRDRIRRGDPFADPDTLRAFESSGVGRFKLRLGPKVRRTFTVRLRDPYRRFVPRRFGVEVWGVPTRDAQGRPRPLPPDEDLSAADQEPPGTFIPVPSRTLRPWLRPGPAYPLPAATTAIRGVVLRGGEPVRWARVVAVVPGTDRAIATAHGDERGEFLLPIPTMVGIWPPAAASFKVDIRLFAAAPASQPPTKDELESRLRDQCADLPVEVVPRAPTPPAPAVLDSPLLRGETIPPGFVEADRITDRDVEVGALTVPPHPYDFVTP